MQKEQFSLKENSFFLQKISLQELRFKDQNSKKNYLFTFPHGTSSLSVVQY